MNEWDALYCEINYLALLVNRHTEYAVWFGMVGHCGWTDIVIAKSKDRYWDKIVEDQINRNITKEEVTYYQNWQGSSSLNKLESIRDQLKHILETGEINYQGFEKIHYETWDYTFFDDEKRKDRGYGIELVVVDRDKLEMKVVEP